MRDARCDINAWMEDEDELFKADVYIRRKLDSIEQNAVPVRPVRDVHQEEDRARRAERRLKLREAVLEVTVMPSSLAPLAASGCLSIPPITLPAKVVVQEAGAGPSLTSHVLNHNPRLGVSASAIIDAFGTSGSSAALGLYAMSPGTPLGLSAAVESAVKAGDSLEVFMTVPDTVSFLDDVDSFKLSIVDPAETWSLKTTQPLLKKHAAFLTAVGAQIIDPAGGPAKILGSSSSSGGAAAAAAGSSTSANRARGGRGAGAAAHSSSSSSSGGVVAGCHIPAPPVVALPDAASAYRAYDTGVTASFQRRYDMGKQGISRADTDVKEALAQNFAPRVRWLTERAGNIAAGLVNDGTFADELSGAGGGHHATRRSSGNAALVDLLRGKRDLRPWVKEALGFPWLLWTGTEGYDDYIPDHIPLLRVITEHSYVDGYSIRAAWVASLNQAGGMPSAPPRQDLLLTAPKSARAAKASYGDIRSEFVYGNEGVSGGSSSGGGRSAAGVLAGKKRSRADLEALLSEEEEDEEDEEDEDEEQDSEEDEDEEEDEEEEGTSNYYEKASGGRGGRAAAAAEDAPPRRRRRRQAHDADLYKRPYNPVGCTSRLRNILAAAAASSSGSGGGESRARKSAEAAPAPIPFFNLPYDLPTGDKVMRVTLSYADPRASGGRAPEGVLGPDGRMSFGPVEALVPMYTVGSLLYESWLRSQGKELVVSPTRGAHGSAASQAGSGSGARRILRLPLPAGRGDGSASTPGSTAAALAAAAPSSRRESEWAQVAEDSTRYGAGTTTTPRTAAASGSGEEAAGSRSGFRFIADRVMSLFRSSESAAAGSSAEAAGASYASPSRSSPHASSGSAGRSSATRRR